MNVTASRYGMRRSYTIETFDLAHYLASLPRDSTVIMKHDIETTEYATLPRLIAQGVLCRVSFLSIEWHLSSLSKGQRLVALAFEHAMPAVMSGCSSAIYCTQDHREPGGLLLSA